MAGDLMAPGWPKTPAPVRPIANEYGLPLYQYNQI
jgi:hypothetical protein